MNLIDITEERDALKDGIYMASNVDNTCAIWDCKIIKNENGRDIIGKLGDIEHLRSILSDNKCEILKRNKMYWFTDRTPHESLAVDKRVFRQYFRLVTHKVSLWHEQHSDKNPNGVMPNENITVVVKGNKFNENNDTINDEKDNAYQCDFDQINDYNSSSYIEFNAYLLNYDNISYQYGRNYSEQHIIERESMQSVLKLNTHKKSFKK